MWERNEVFVLGKGKRDALALDALISVAVMGATQAAVLVPLTAFLAKRFEFVFSPFVIVGVILIILMMDFLVIGLATASARSQRDQFENGGEECK